MISVQLKPDRMNDEQEIIRYFHEILRLPDHHARNMDSLKKYLAESYQEETVFRLNEESVHELCKSRNGYAFLLALGQISDQNKHINIQFDEEVSYEEK